MRSYVTVVDGDIDILPFFAKYYTQQLGVDEFCLLTFGTPEHERDAHNILAGYAKVVIGPRTPANKFLAGTRDRIIRHIHKDGEWAFFTDMDEFPQIVTPTAIAEAKESYVSGVWLDRVSETGKIISITRDKKLVEQFPMGARTRKYLGYHANAYILSKHAPFSHHPSVCKRAKPYPPSRKYVIHHFKWAAGVKRRLKTRFKRVSLSGRNTGWKNSIARTVRMLDKNAGVPKKLLAPVKQDIDI